MTNEPSLSNDSKPFVILPDPAKLEALAEFAGGAGHEINNPLATIIGRAQLLLKDEKDPQRRQMLMSIGAQAYRIRDMIGDTMLYGRPPLPEIKDVDLAEVVNGVVDAMTNDRTDRDCSVRFMISQPITLRADPVQLAIVMKELLQNARQAAQPKGSDILICAKVESNHAVIELTDSGKGFTEEERKHAFNPFFSGRQAGRGLGFGLPKCWRIITQHKGQIQIQSSPTGPTTVRITWPIAE